MVNSEKTQFLSREIFAIPLSTLAEMQFEPETPVMSPEAFTATLKLAELLVTLDVTIIGAVPVTVTSFPSPLPLPV